MTPRNIFRLVLAIGAAGYLAWMQLAPHHDAARSAAASAARDTEPPPPPRTLGALAFQPCTLASKFSPTPVAAQCTRMAVPEDRAHPQARSIDLAIAWVPADDDDAAPDPVFMLAGGPGQSALETYPAAAAAFAHVLKKRNVILVDQRGTGGSNPLECKGSDDSQADPATQSDPARIRALTATCRDALEKKADLRFYTTTDAIADLDAVRAAIGADKIDLVGISYGTRVAQQYARTYAAHTRAVVLDSVAPNELILGNEFARNLQDALADNFKLCAGIPACARRMGDPTANLDGLLAKLKAQPQPVSWRDPLTGETRQGTLTRDEVATLARMYAYTPLALATLPLSLSEALAGRYDTLKAQAVLLGGQLSGAMTTGMQLSVICSEDADGLKPDPAMDASVLGNQIVANLQASCAVWPHGQRPADFHQPLVSALPILVLEGQFDPVTPPRYGAQVVKHLRNGRLLVLRGQGHNVIGVGCMPRLLARFIDTADAKSLDANCLDALPATPPFTSFNGWEP